MQEYRLVAEHALLEPFGEIDGLIAAIVKGTGRAPEYRLTDGRHLASPTSAVREAAKIFRGVADRAAC
jgi:hypothetical protein